MRKIVMLLCVLLLITGVLFAGGKQEAAPEPVIEAEDSTPAEPGPEEGGTYVPDKKVTLRFWHSYSGYSERLFKGFVEEFEKENPKIEIKLEYGGNLWTMRDKLLTAIAGGAAPDLAEIDSYWTPIFAEGGALVNMEPYMARPGYNKDDLQMPSLISTQYDGKSYSIPFNLSNIVLYYNKKYFEEAGLDPEAPPTTWDEVIEYGKILTIDQNGDGAPERWGLGCPLKADYGAIWYWLAFFWQQEGELFNESETEATFNSEAGVAATNLWRELVHEAKILSLSQGWSDFESGITAMDLGSSSSLARRRENMGGDVVGISLLPGGKQQASVSGGGNLAMFSNCEDKEAAWEFLKWVGSTEITRRWSIATGSIPVRKSASEEPEFKDYLLKDPRNEISIQGIPFTRVRPNIPEYGDASRIIAYAAEEAVFTNTDPKPLLDKAKIEVDALFTK
jgi:ABC-type glycerol-3-phosphate transport system substrate-binding protein